jgi:Kef-type K+ transport system membrane component KefB
LILLFVSQGCAVSMALGLPTSAAVTIGGSLALSSSAFVLQLLKDKNQMGTRAGKASFGILLLQDLAVVPLLVVVELLAKGGTGLGKALSIAGLSHCHYGMRNIKCSDSFCVSALAYYFFTSSLPLRASA